LSPKTKGSKKSATGVSVKERNKPSGTRKGPCRFKKRKQANRDACNWETGTGPGLRSRTWFIAKEQNESGNKLI